MVDAVVGIDAGGTSTRAIVVATGPGPAGVELGTVLARTTGTGANRWSSDADPAGTLVEVAVRALATAADDGPPTEPVATVVAVAGAPERLADELGPRWATSGRRLGPAPRVVPDVHAAYAAGTSSPDGVVLAAGTGAIGAGFVGGSMVRRVDGHGWILGDRGSAVWISRRAIQAVLAALDGLGPATRLEEVVRRELLDGGTHHRTDLTAAIIAAVHSRPPATIGALAPAVLACADAGDDVAGTIIDSATRALADTLVAAAGGAGSAGPAAVVLAGSVLERNPRLASRVVERARAAWADRPPVTIATDGAAGAAMLALEHLTGRSVWDDLHARLCSPTPVST